MTGLSKYIMNTLGKCLQFDKGNGSCIVDKDTHIEILDSNQDYTKLKADYAIEQHDVLVKYQDISQGGVKISNSPPEHLDGDVLWYNTIHNELFYYDILRDKWLSIASNSLTFNASGSTEGGAYLLSSGEDNVPGFNIGDVCITEINYRVGSIAPTVDQDIIIRGVSLEDHNTTDKATITILQPGEGLPASHSDNTLDIDISNESINIYCPDSGSTLNDVCVVLNYRKNA